MNGHLQTIGRPPIRSRILALEDPLLEAPLAPLAEEDRLRQGRIRWLGVVRLCHTGATPNLADFRKLFSSLHGIGHRIALFVRASRSSVTVALAVVLGPSRPGMLDLASAGDLLEHHVRARFPGSEVETWLFQDILPQLGSFERLPHVGALVGLPSSFESDTRWCSPVQDLLMALSDRELAFVVLADPLDRGILDQEFERTSDFLQETMATASREVQRSLQTSHGEHRRQAETGEQQQSRTQGETQSLGNTTAQSVSQQTSMGLQMAGTGVSTSLLFGEQRSVAETLGRSIAISYVERCLDERSREESSTRAETVTESRRLDDIRATLAAELLDEERRRLLQGMSVGAWQVGVYVAAEDRTTLHVAGQILRGTLAGPGSSQRPLTFREISAENARVARQCLEHLCHLCPTEDSSLPPLTTLMHSGELALTAAFPSESVPGFEVREAVIFGQGAPRPKRHARTAILGSINSFGRRLPARLVEIDVDELTMHVLVTGTTGSGKTTTTLELLAQLWKEHRLPFLVVDPKEEYRERLSSLIPKSFFRAIGVDAMDWRINPFAVPAGRSLAIYAEQLRSLFCASFETEAAMPELILQAILEVYRQRGWDLRTSQSRKDAAFPTLTDLQNEIPKTVERNGFSGQLASNYRAALGARIRSLRNGWKGEMLDGQERSGDGLDTLLGQPAVLDVSQMDPAGRAFLMGLLVLKLNGIRRRQGSSGGELRHLIVLEEAHHLLRNPASLGGVFGGARAHALESLLNSIAELRAFGQGILVAEQSPQELHPAVLRGTNLKILHRLIEGRDQEAAAEAAGLDDLQRRELGFLQAGQAVVRAATWESAVAIDIRKG